ncbi:MAG: Rrf2 family transcriptional regulator [Saprospiraceae bacterium]|nr:Rrf2 family transcriptional regulator [Saprospiraceae bacterium]
MRVISKSGEYGLRALLHMASNQENEGFFNIREMSEELDISFHFLTKILQVLTQKGILQSYRGPNGGVGFLKSPEEITLSELVRALEGDDFFDKCLLGLPGCGERQPCPMHAYWMGIRNNLKSEFETTSLADLGKNTRLQHLRLIA